MFHYSACVNTQQSMQTQDGLCNNKNQLDQVMEKEICGNQDSERDKRENEF